jgi:hypothetical protein
MSGINMIVGVTATVALIAMGALGTLFAVKDVISLCYRKKRSGTLGRPRYVPEPCQRKEHRRRVDSTLRGE